MVRDAARQGNNRVLQQWLGGGGAVDGVCERSGMTLLMVAAASARVETVALLLRAGAGVAARAPDGRTALAFARAAAPHRTSDAEQKMVQMLKDAGATDEAAAPPRGAGGGQAHGGAASEADAAKKGGGCGGL